MRRSLGILFLSAATLAPAASAATYRHNYQHPHKHHSVYSGHHHIIKTVARVGVGAASGAAIGAIAAGGPGAAIGAIVGGGAGAFYDLHEKRHGR